MRYPNYTGIEPCTTIGFDLYTADIPKGSKPVGLELMREACLSCETYLACREWALHHENAHNGFWAGMTGNERRIERARLGITVVDPITFANNGVGDRRIYRATTESGTRSDGEAA